jgi:hypothetical protein
MDCHWKFPLEPDQFVRGGHSARGLRIHNKPSGGIRVRRLVRVPIARTCHEKTSASVFVGAVIRTRTVRGARAIRAGARYRVLGQRRRRVRSLDAAAYRRLGRAVAGRPLRSRSAPDSIWEQSDSAGWNAGRGRYRFGRPQPQVRTATWAQRRRTQRDRDRSIFRNQTTSVELGAAKPLLHVRANFASRSAERPVVYPAAEGNPGGGARAAIDRAAAKSRRPPAAPAGLDALIANRAIFVSANGGM